MAARSRFGSANACLLGLGGVAVLGVRTHRRHGCLSLLSVVCNQVKVSETGSSLVQRSPTECGVIAKPRKGRSCYRIGSKRHRRKKCNIETIVY